MAVAAAASAEEGPAVAGKERLSKKAHAQVAAAVDAAEDLTGLQFCVYLGPAAPTRGRTPKDCSWTPVCTSVRR